MVMVGVGIPLRVSFLWSMSAQRAGSMSTAFPLAFLLVATPKQRCHSECVVRKGVESARVFLVKKMRFALVLSFKIALISIRPGVSLKKEKRKFSVVFICIFCMVRFLLGCCQPA